MLCMHDPTQPHHNTAGQPHKWILFYRGQLWCTEKLNYFPKVTKPTVTGLGLESEPYILTTLLYYLPTRRILSDLLELYTVNPHFSQILHVQIHLLVNIYCNTKVIYHSAFMIIGWHVQSSEQSESPDVYVPNRGWTGKALPSCLRPHTVASMLFVVSGATFSEFLCFFVGNFTVLTTVLSCCLLSRVQEDCAVALVCALDEPPSGTSYRALARSSMSQWCGLNTVSLLILFEGGLGSPVFFFFIFF